MFVDRGRELTKRFRPFDPHGRDLFDVETSGPDQPLDVCQTSKSPFSFAPFIGIGFGTLAKRVARLRQRDAVRFQSLDQILWKVLPVCGDGVSVDTIAGVEDEHQPAIRPHRVPHPRQRVHAPIRRNVLQQFVRKHNVNTVRPS